METPRSTQPHHSWRGRPAWMLAIIATALALMLGTVTSAAAAPAEMADPGDLAKIDRLTGQIKTLEKAYGGNIEQLRDARLDARKAVTKARKLQADLTEARALVAQLAASQYMNSGLDPSAQLLAAGDPNEVLDGASLASHVSQRQAARVQQIQTLIARQEQARKDAEDKIKKLEGDVKQIARRKEQVAKLLRRYKPESPLIGSGGMTPRMITVRNEIEAEFGPFVAIGCTRPGDPRDHGSGQACDFMESSAGALPSAERVAHGDRVAAYAIDNASRLGIKYVIWRQRIYDLRNPGWKPMSDRGGVTQNHMDHNHISVF